MLRQPMALLAGVGKRLLAAGSQAPKRKLLFLVFLWTSLCLLLFKSTLFSSSSNPVIDDNQQQDTVILQQEAVISSSNNNKVRARAAVSVAPVVLAAAPAKLEPPANYYSIESSSHSSIHSPESISNNQRSLPRQQSSSLKTARKSAATPATHTRQHNEKQSVPPVAGSLCHYDYPSLFDLQFNNIHWQKLITKDDNWTATATAQQSAATYYLYNAYYDDRLRAGLPSVRILAMIDRIQPPPTNCLLWSSKLTRPTNSNKLAPIVTRATFVYAWYPKWGNYKDGILQPWIVTCPLARGHLDLVPDSVSLVQVPPALPPPPVTPKATTTSTRAAPMADELNNDDGDLADLASQRAEAEQASVIIPPSFSSSSSSSSSSSTTSSNSNNNEQSTRPMQQVEYDCQKTLPITNNLPVYNKRPGTKGKFAVCVKGLDFPHDDVSVRLVEWIEMLNLLGASKIFLYELDVHENISKVLHYYQQRGLVELSPLTLPGDQPNLPEYQHLYLKNKLTAKRQNELIPYNDCLYRNLYSYEYLALLDIDEVIMPLGKHLNWYDLMEQVEALSLSEQNYSRASYNVRNVYFFDDLSGPLGTTSTSSSSPSSGDSDLGDTQFQQLDSQTPNKVDTESQDEEDEESARGSGETGRRGTESLERGIPHYLHMMSHVYRSKNYTEPGQYVKCFHNTERVVSLHNHFPMNCFGQCTTYSIPVHLAHLQHYRKDCVGPLKQSCKNDFRVFTTRDTTIWKYKQRMIRRTTRVLNHLGLLAGSRNVDT